MKNHQVSHTNEKALARRVKNHVIGKTHRFFAVVHPGFERVARAELEKQQAIKIVACDFGGIEFQGKLSDLYELSLTAGTISRFLMRLYTKQVLHLRQFRQYALEFPWELYLADGAMLGFSISIARSRLRYKRLLSDALFASIQDRLSRFDRTIALGNDPESQDHDNQQVVFVRLDNNKAHISLDASGKLLYFRGYQRRTEKASIRETLARCILMSAGLGQYDILIDPLAGSGTFSLEATMVYTNHPAGLERSFAFEKWPAFRPVAFAHLKKQLVTRMSQNGLGVEKKIYCSDKSEKAVETIRYNIDLTGSADRIILDRRDFFDIPAAVDPERTLLVMNPPYGLRMGTQKSVEQLYRNIGSKLRSDFHDCGVAVLVPSLELEKIMGLAHDEKLLFRNGGKQVALLIKYASGKKPGWLET